MYTNKIIEDILNGAISSETVLGELLHYIGEHALEDFYNNTTIFKESHK